MKTTEKIDYGFKREIHFRNNYSFLEQDFRIGQIYNQGFIVPWQMFEKEEKKVLVE